MCSQVDVLTLSATPIPRTLNMALSGIRDMSTIEEPPQDRQPVQTYVHGARLGRRWREAIRRELDRGGQVYYLHNRVENIESDRRTAAPVCWGRRCAVGMAHGKMTEQELSRRDAADDRRRGDRCWSAPPSSRRASTSPT